MKYNNLKRALFTSTIVAGMALSSNAAILNFESLTTPALGATTAGSVWTINSNDCCGSSGVIMSATDLKLGGSYQNGSAFSTNTLSLINVWTTTFTVSENDISADASLAFVLQNDTRGALALNTMNSGYTGKGAAITPAYSVVFANNSVGFISGGAAAAVNAAATQATGLDFKKPINVTLDYAGTTLSLVATDGVNTFNTSSTVNLGSVVGSNTGYAGFSVTSKGTNVLYTITNPSLMVIPEPGTYAFLAGVVVIGFALIRRKLINK